MTESIHPEKCGGKCVQFKEAKFQYFKIHSCLWNPGLVFVAVEDTVVVMEAFPIGQVTKLSVERAVDRREATV